VQRISRKTFRLLHVIFFLLAFLTACASPNEEFIQGEWFFDNQERRANPSAYHIPFEDWEEFTFDGGRYQYYACCNHNINDSGRYYVSKSDGNVVVLNLVCEVGNCITDGYQIEIAIDKENETIRFFHTT